MTKQATSNASSDFNPAKEALQAHIDNDVVCSSPLEHKMRISESITNFGENAELASGVGEAANNLKAMAAAVLLTSNFCSVADYPTDRTCFENSPTEITTEIDHVDDANEAIDKQLKKYMKNQIDITQETTNIENLTPQLVIDDFR